MYFMFYGHHDVVTFEPRRRRKKEGARFAGENVSFDCESLFESPGSLLLRCVTHRKTNDDEVKSPLHFYLCELVCKLL